MICWLAIVKQGRIIYKNNPNRNVGALSDKGSLVKDVDLNKFDYL